MFLTHLRPKVDTYIFLFIVCSSSSFKQPKAVSSEHTKPSRSEGFPRRFCESFIAQQERIMDIGVAVHANHQRDLTPPQHLGSSVLTRPVVRRNVSDAAHGGASEKGMCRLCGNYFARGLQPRLAVTPFLLSKTNIEGCIFSTLSALLVHILFSLEPPLFVMLSFCRGRAYLGDPF
ncbi:hypothetical protein BDN67DRAFT_150759 [Paxillus ammoniavirescens]|nr:hypothetical protein BDN67DRAFT_150759 [Paxillus ammoniavirescens]